MARIPTDVLAAVAVGGAAGALARWAVAIAWPPGRTGFPWATLVINASGCLLIGVLMVFIGEVWADARLVRPLLGTGVLGGYTTFSAYTVDTVRLVHAGAAGAALMYLMATPVLALISVYLGTALGRRMTRRSRA